MAEIDWRRSQLAVAKTSVEQVAVQLELDNLLDELAKRNASIIADRVAKGSAS